MRTPLATIVGELQLALIKERSVAEYKEVIRLSLGDAQRLVRLSNGLLDLAKASYDQTTVSMKELRTDELLMDAREAVLKINEGYKVDIVFEREIDDDDDISVKGNEYLLKVAFINLMENACKFSANHQCAVSINFDHDRVKLGFKDSGIGIAKDELESIFSAFYRGKNKDFSREWDRVVADSKVISMHQGVIVLLQPLTPGVNLQSTCFTFSSWASQKNINSIC